MPRLRGVSGFDEELNRYEALSLVRRVPARSVIGWEVAG